MASNNLPHHKQHDYHLVDPSPWPLLASFALLILTIGMVMFMHKHAIGKIIAPAGFLLVLYTMYVWWRDVIKEGKVDYAHTSVVRRGLSIGMALFILSEVMFFFAFFWSFFKASLFPEMILDGAWPVKEGMWPPAGIETFDPWDIPFTNTLILLLSGTTVTWAHHALLENNQKEVVQGLTITVILGIIFSCIQAFEYFHAPFKFTDGIYASNFYMATGFHGFHVLIGTIFLAVCLFRAKKGHFKDGNGHLGFEFAAWYWHFVDVVWLFLYIFVYLGA
jgi:cytochrome c oxidase subunit 3